MAQPAGYSKNPLNINPFWEKAYVDPPVEWSTWPAIVEMAIFAKDGIEVRNLLRARPTIVKPSEPIYEVEITGEKSRHKGRTERSETKKKELVGKTT